MEGDGVEVAEVLVDEEGMLVLVVEVEEVEDVEDVDDVVVDDGDEVVEVEDVEDVEDVVVDGGDDVVEVDDVELEVEVGRVLVDVVVAGGGGPVLLVPFRDPTYALKLYFSHVLAIFKPPYPFRIGLPFLLTWKY